MSALLPIFRGRVSLSSVFCAVDKLAPHPLPFICATVGVYSAVGAALSHKPLCVNPQRKGFEICDRGALALALLPSLAASLHSHVTMKHRGSRHGPMHGAGLPWEESLLSPGPNNRLQSGAGFLYPLQSRAGMVRDNEWPWVGVGRCSPGRQGKQAETPEPHCRRIFPWKSTSRENPSLRIFAFICWIPFSWTCLRFVFQGDGSILRTGVFYKEVERKRYFPKSVCCRSDGHVFQRELKTTCVFTVLPGRRWLALPA